MAVIVKCSVLCDDCGKSVDGSMLVAHTYADGCYTVLYMRQMLISGLEGMIVKGTTARCANQAACRSRKLLADPTKSPDGYGWSKDCDAKTGPCGCGATHRPSGET